MEHSGSFISGFGFGRTASSPVRPRCSCARADGDDVFREGVQEGSDKLQRAPSERVSGVTTACQDEGDGACSVAHHFISKIRQNAFLAISLIGSQMCKKLHKQLLKNLVGAV